MFKRKRKHDDGAVVDRQECPCDHCAAIREFRSALGFDQFTQDRHDNARKGIFGRRRGNAIR